MEKKLYELTNPQKSIWLTEEYYKGTNINNIAGTMTINQAVDFDKFILAIKQFVKQNDSCRIMLTDENEKVEQWINAYEDFSIEIVDVTSNNELMHLTNEILSKSFSLYNSYLFKFVVFRFPDNHGGFIVNMHHLISDAWTLGIVVNEIVSIYASLINNESYEEKDITNYSYLNYIDSEKDYEKSNKYEKDKMYWEEVFSTIPEVATIPHVSNSNEDSVEALRQQLSIPSDTLTKIKEYCANQKVSIFNFLVAIFSVYISKVSNLDDFCIGTPILNRSNFKEKNTTGMFINTLPIRISICNHTSFINFLSQVSSNSMALLRHQKYSYQNIIEDLRKNQSNLPSLYKIMLSYQITKMNKDQDIIPHESNWFFNGTMSDDIDIHIFDLNDENKLNIAYDYKVSKYNSTDMTKIHNRILSIISQVLDNTDLLISDIEIVTPDEKNKLIKEFNETQMDYPKNKTIATLFEEQVLLTPDNTALVFENKSLTYKELNEKANQLAYFLRANGIKNNSIVGIMVNRSLEVIIAILAVLKSGGAYIPIDPDYPAERVDYLLENSNCSMLLTQKDLLDKVKVNCKKIDITLSNQDIYTLPKSNLVSVSNPDDISYLIYTSGSTGKPKGAMLTHKALVNLTYYCNNIIPYLKNRENKAIVSVTTVSFDIFIYETLISLQRGLKLVIANNDEQNIPHCLDKLIENENIEIIQTTPSRMQLFYNQLDDMPHLHNLNYIILAGEPLPISLKNNLKQLTNGKIFNGYGPSETTVFSTLTDVTNYKEITIGKPLANTQIYILDRSLKPCPIGVSGEIYISGDGVGLGYMQNSDLTAKSFISNPFVSNSIMYKTGDLGYYQENGEIVCLGRSDHQVKIRGLRIELEEIETILSQHPSISNCVTVKKVSPDGHEFLCAYYTANESIGINELRSILARKLPNYMIPQYFVKLDSLPYTPNGKIDKKSLPEPEFTNINAQKKFVRHRNDLDKELVSLLEDLLNLKQISIEDSFYDLGGDSLSAIRLCTALYHKIHIQIAVKDILTHPIIKDLSDFIDNKININNSLQIKQTATKDFYPTSSAQKRIYYASQVEEDSILYNIPGGLLLEQTPDITKLEKCLGNLITRHSSLRTYFDLVDGTLVQRIIEPFDFKLEIKNVKWKDREKITKEFIKPFDLHKPLLFRIKLFLFENNKALLLLDMHHSIYDGASLSILLEELCNLYNNNTLREKQIDYKDFAIWENQYLQSKEYKEDKEYWLSQFSGEIPVLDMPSTLQRPNKKSINGDSISFTIDKALSDKISLLAKKENITPYMLLLSAYFVLLYKYTGQKDIIVGTPIINRERPELSNLLGMFVNDLALRGIIDSSINIHEFFMQIKELCLKAFEHQSYPFDELVKDLKLKRDISRNPIFDTMFIYQNDGFRPVNLGDISTSYYVPKTSIAKLDLALEVIPSENGFSFNFEYCTDIFTKSYMEQLITYYKTILKHITLNDSSTIASIKMLPENEYQKIVTKFNNTFMPYNKDVNIVDLFEKQVKAHPNEVAIVFENNSVTYKELNEMANRLAHYLISNYHVKRNQIIGIMLNRSLETIISMLAIIKSGAAYLLIDSSLPFDRIIYMLENSNSNLLITSSFMKQIDFPNQLLLDKVDLNYSSKNNLDTYISNEDILSVVYTSGSTGLPKGVLVKKLGMLNLILSYKNHIKIDNYDTFLSICSISFDMFAVEIWIPLTSGKKIVLANDEQSKIPNYISELITKYSVDYTLITPSKLQLLLDTCPDCLKLLKSIQLGGETLTPAIYERLSSYTNAIICNEYGPSECTSCSTYKEITNGNNITIGKPFYNTQIYICDKDINLKPIGFTGEICISGDGVTNGYINNKALTEKSFIDNPFGFGKLYKTGDLGYFTQDGEIAYVGRKDFQVKIRGLRIELSEIEKQLVSFQSVSNAAVICSANEAEKYLVAYYTSNDVIEQNVLRNYLAEKLPNYMIPKYFVQLDVLPLSSNGKIDKKALESRKAPTSQNSIPKSAPENEIQKLFCDIWTNLLKAPIGIDDDIFEEGADSLLAIKFKTELLAHKINIPYADIFKYTTIRKLSEIHHVQADIDSNVHDMVIDRALANNNIETLSHNFSCKKENHILLLGGNGFVGSHIIYEFIKNDTGKIYCIIRDKKEQNAYERFKKILHFYFGEELDQYLGKRIFMLTGNVLEKDFGLPNKQFSELMQNISIIINAAAIVKHYGNEEKFKTINVDLTRKLVEISKQYQKRFLQISTTSIAGSSTVSSTFSEANLDIGQTIDNSYVKSKFEAEQIILREIENGLDAQILRLGNITNRFCDGKFQINPKENSFVNRLQSFIKLQAIPTTLNKVSLEFTPVDLCAKAIIKIMQNNLPYFNIYHLYNDNTITMEDFIKSLKDLGYSISSISMKDFQKNVEQILNDKTQNDILFGIINDFDKDLDYSNKMQVSSNLTKTFLAKLDFSWPKIDQSYIEQYIQYFKQIKLI